MGWVNSVDLILNWIRKFAFQTCGVNPDWEVRGDRGLPLSTAAVVCMDGVDILPRLKVVRDCLAAAHGHLSFSKVGMCLGVARFVS